VKGFKKADDVKGFKKADDVIGFKKAADEKGLQKADGKSLEKADVKKQPGRNFAAEVGFDITITVANEKQAKTYFHCLRSSTPEVLRMPPRGRLREIGKADSDEAGAAVRHSISRSIVMLAGCCVLVLLMAGCRAPSYARSQASYAPRSCDAELYALGLRAAEAHQLAEQGWGCGAALGLQRQRQSQCADQGGAKRTRPPLARRDPPAGDPRRQQQCADFGGAKRTRPPLVRRDPPAGDPRRQQQCADQGGAKRTRPPLACRDPPHCCGGDPRRKRGRPMATVKQKATVGKSRYLRQPKRLADEVRDTRYDGVVTPKDWTWRKPRSVDSPLLAAVAFDWKGERSVDSMSILPTMQGEARRRGAALSGAPVTGAMNNERRRQCRHPAERACYVL
jgi:hypothetical protein